MKNLSVFTILATTLAVASPAAAANTELLRQYAALSTAAEDNGGEIDHNADGMGEGDATIVAPASDVNPTPAPPATPNKPKPIIKPGMVKKSDSGTDVPAPKSAKARKVAAAPAKEIPLIETDNPVESSPDVNYVTGGIGEGEKASIEAAKSDYNLYVMSASSNGAFVGDARVVISSNGKELLNVVAGPLLYVKLPQGSYVLDASLGEQKKHQAFTIKKGGSANVHLGWNVPATVTGQ